MTSLTNTQSETNQLRRLASNYFDDQPIAITKCNGGIINTTYKLQLPSGQQYILQRLSTLFTPDTILDFQKVAIHLHRAEWPVQQVVPAKNGSLWCRDVSGGLWRMLSYIDGTDAPDPMSTAQLHEVGALLARLHIDLHKLNYQPRFTLKHFHDTAFYRQALAKVHTALPTPKLRELSKSCLMAYAELRELPPAEPQLIHGDPRTTNILFRDKHPVCYIDFDALMYHSPWTDIGDLLRSINGSNNQITALFSIKRTAALMQGYYSINSSIAPTFQVCMERALCSMRLISIELAMRFLTDVVKDIYFDWDTELFANRRDNNIARAQAQWNIYESSM